MCVPAAERAQRVKQGRQVRENQLGGRYAGGQLIIMGKDWKTFYDDADEEGDALRLCIIICVKQHSAEHAAYSN